MPTRRRAERPPACPTPQKVKHPSKVRAEIHLLSLQKTYGPSAGLAAYRCACGSWHVGHSERRLSAAIRRALRR